MASIINGLFSGRAGVKSHGEAIGVVSDNVANVSTLAFKAARADFEDLIAGGQSVGSGSAISSVRSIFQQGTLEFTERSLDLAIDGNGFFVVADGAERYYQRAGNFKLDPSGFIVNQKDQSVLGFPVGGSGTLEPININTISQSSVATTELTVAGNIDATEPTTSSIPTAPDTGSTGTTVDYSDLSNAAAFSTYVDVFDNQGGSHTITFFFFKTAQNTWTTQGFVNSEEVDTGGSPSVGYPRRIIDSSSNGDIALTFNSSGARTNTPATGSYDLTADIPWNNGSGTSTINITFDPFTQYAANSNINAITQDGEGVGSVTSISIEKNGDIFAVLSNGQSSTIGTIGLANFANPEGLKRIGNQLYQQSPASGEPLVGTPGSGTNGEVQAGAVELSTVDIADEFVRLITLQQGFQASSSMIRTINELLRDILQLA